MPPTWRGQQRWDAALHVAGEPVFMNTGGATLPQASFQQLLGWVAAPSEGGNLTDLGMQAIIVLLHCSRRADILCDSFCL